MMKNLIKLVLLSVLGALVMVMASSSVLAKEVGYKTYKYGTSQTSMADGYYARPAQVVARGNHYLVTMTIRTKHSLSPWPVKVQTVNGQTPVKVTKTRHGSDYDYNYSFYAQSLAHKISSSISIDVPKLYKANHQISFMFDQDLPPLKKNRHEVLPMKSKAPSTSQAPKSSPSQKDNSQDLVEHAKKQSEAIKQEEAALAEQRLKQNQKNRMDNERNERMFYYVMAGGVVCLIILVIACVFFVLSVKNKAKGKK